MYYFNLGKDFIIGHVAQTRLFFCLILVALVSCSSFPKDDIVFKSSAAPGVDFDDYKRFSWLSSSIIVNDPNGFWEPPEIDADQETKLTIDKTLRRLGYIETADDPDFLVVYSAGINMEALEFNRDTEFGVNTVSNTPKAALSIIFIDAETERPLWIATAMGDLHNHVEAGVAKQRIHYAVESMMDSLPWVK